LSYGAYPTLAFKQSITRLNGKKFASPRATSPNMEDKVVNMQK